MLYLLMQRNDRQRVGFQCDARQCDGRSERNTAPGCSGVAAPGESPGDDVAGALAPLGGMGGAGAGGVEEASIGPGSKSPILWTSGAGLCVIFPLILGPKAFHKRSSAHDAAMICQGEGTGKCAVRRPGRRMGGTGPRRPLRCQKMCAKIETKWRKNMAMTTP